MKKSAILKSASEITGLSGCIGFHGNCYSYTEILNKHAGRRYNIIPINNSDYDYKLYEDGIHSFKVLKNWLKDIHEESEVKTGWVDFYYVSYFNNKKKFLPCFCPSNDEYVTIFFNSKEEALAARIPDIKYIKSPVKVNWKE